MTSNLASEEIADHGLQLRQEADEVSKKRKSGKLGGRSCFCINFCTKRLCFFCVSATFMYWSKNIRIMQRKCTHVVCIVHFTKA